MVKRSPKPLPSKTKKKWLSILQSSVAKKKTGADRLRVVIDTNVWYSAIAHGGKSETTLRYCLSNCEIVLSSEIVDELHNLLRNYLKVPYRWLNTFMRLLDDLCEIHETRTDVTIDSPIRDPNDQHVIAAARGAKSDLMITGDKDLLELKNCSVDIITPAEFVALIKTP